MQVISTIYKSDILLRIVIIINFIALYLFTYLTALVIILYFIATKGYLYKHINILNHIFYSFYKFANMHKIKKQHKKT